MLKASTVTPFGCAKLSLFASVTPVPPAPGVPTAVMTPISWFVLSMRTVWPGAKPVTFVTLMLVAPITEGAARVAAAWTNLAQYRWVRGVVGVTTCSPSALLVSGEPVGGFVLLVPVRIDQV